MSLRQAVIFAAGAVVGGGVATIFHQRNVAQSSKMSQESPGTVVAGPVTFSSAVDLPVLKYGNPGPIADPLVRKAYVAAYDRRLRHPAWTAEHLTLTSLGRSVIKFQPSTQNPTEVHRSKSTFTEDESIPASFRSTLLDYSRSGYDRGHMVPAADARMSQEAMNETFLLSNIAPQVGNGFNRHYWAYLEDWCRRLTSSFEDVYVFTIPLYLPKKDPDGKWRVTHEVIGSPPNVSVPTHFAKVVLTTKPSTPSTPTILELSAGAFVLPNAAIPDETPLTDFVVPVEAVERAAGLNFFSDSVKSSSKHICNSTKCEVIVRRFNDAQRPPLRRAASAPPTISR